MKSLNPLFSSYKRISKPTWSLCI